MQPGESSDIALSFHMLITDICLSENTPILLCDILDWYGARFFKTYCFGNWFCVEI